jgi:antitoxin VapB
MVFQAKPSAEPKTTAKLFMHGRSQAVRLPRDFRFEGTEVRVRREGEKAILEPLNPAPFDFAAWRAKLDTYLDIPFPDLPDDPPAQVDEVSFD